MCITRKVTGYEVDERASENCTRGIREGGMSLLFQWTGCAIFMSLLVVCCSLIWSLVVTGIVRKLRANLFVTRCWPKIITDLCAHGCLLSVMGVYVHREMGYKIFEEMMRSVMKVSQDRPSVGQNRG